MRTYEKIFSLIIKMWDKLTDLEKTKIKRALTAGGLWAAVSSGIIIATGGQVNPMDAVTEGGLLAGSYWTADYLHEMMGKDKDGNFKADFKPLDTMTHALYTGGLFTGLQVVVNGSDAYLQNFAAGAGTAYLEDMVFESMAEKDESA